MATILVIEDDPSFRELLELYLQSAGHTVRVAADPEEGLRRFLKDPPGLILLDLDLPYLSGFEVLWALRSDEALQKIPIMVVTSRTDDETRERCRKMGVDAFASKPLKREELLDAVGKVLAARTDKRRTL